MSRLTSDAVFTHAGFANRSGFDLRTGGGVGRADGGAGRGDAVVDWSEEFGPISSGRPIRVWQPVGSLVLRVEPSGDTHRNFAASAGVQLSIPAKIHTARIGYSSGLVVFGRVRGRS